MKGHIFVSHPTHLSPARLDQLRVAVERAVDDEEVKVTCIPNDLDVEVLAPYVFKTTPYVLKTTMKTKTEKHSV